MSGQQAKGFLFTPATLERAARNLCQIRKLDPDAIVEGALTLTKEDGTQETQDLPLWAVMQQEVVAAIEVQQAVGLAVQGKDARGMPADLKSRMILPPGSH